MRALVLAIDVALEYYVWFLLAAAVRFIDPHRRAVAAVDISFRAASWPVRRPIQKILPNLGGIDISPIVALILVVAVRYVIKLFILPHMRLDYGIPT